jgi:hypothetical protein
MLLSPGVFSPEPILPTTRPVVGVEEAAEEDEILVPVPATAAAPPPLLLGGPTPTAVLVFRFMVLLDGVVDPKLFLRLWGTEDGILLGTPPMLVEGTVAWVDVLLRRWCSAGEVTGLVVAWVSVGTVPPRTGCGLAGRRRVEVGLSGTNSCGERT